MDGRDLEPGRRLYSRVSREDEAQFGTYRTRDLILAYMHALAAGDTDTTVAL